MPEPRGSLAGRSCRILGSAQSCRLDEAGLGRRADDPVDDRFLLEEHDRRGGPNSVASRQAGVLVDRLGHSAIAARARKSSLVPPIH